MYFFFFQAEDGIRDYKVTGVQTCALPISTFSAGTGSRRTRLPRPAPPRCPACTPESRPPPLAPGGSRPARGLVSCATPTPANRRQQRPRGRAAHRRASCVRVLAPGPLVVAGLVKVQLAEAALRFLDDAAALGDLRRVVGLPDLVMEQLAPGVAEQLLQLRGGVEQPPSPGAVQLLNPLG